MKQIVLNRIRTPDGTVLTSRHVHDYKCYKDTKSLEIYTNDGGLSYLKRSVNKEPYEDISLYSDDPFEILRENITWGTYGRNGNEPLQYKSISKMSTLHINAILSQYKLVEHLKEIFEKESSFRNECEQKGWIERHWRED